ncbi:MAG: dephospho-CoA kinase [Ruminococcus sp.]|nr:dephospho-CoA kinase [Ruminococcus sp.]
MKNYKLIGLTGTTGSGKSVVRDIFEENGYKVIDADILARKAIKNCIVEENILLMFGVDLMTSNGIDRKELAKRAFKDKASVNILNSIMHPHITTLFINELKELTASGNEKIIFDAPQLFEAGMDIICDDVVAVCADEDIRIKRITKRDNISEETAKKRIRIQFSDSFFKENCDYYIENNSTLEDLKAKVKEIISKI